MTGLIKSQMSLINRLVTQERDGTSPEGSAMLKLFESKAFTNAPEATQKLMIEALKHELSLKHELQMSVAQQQHVERHLKQQGANEVKMEKMIGKNMRLQTYANGVCSVTQTLADGSVQVVTKLTDGTVNVVETLADGTVKVVDQNAPQILEITERYINPAVMMGDVPRLTSFG
jgi:hypothetical protein